MPSSDPEYTKKYYAKNKEKIKSRLVKWKLDNRDHHLGQQKEWRALHAKQRQEYERKRRYDLKQKLLNHYGRKCVCCGEENESVLCFDHINEDGSKHRKSIGIGSGTQFNWWLLKNNFPPGFQVLCHNCNFCKWSYGQCSHKGPPLKTGGPRYDYMKKLRFSVRLKAISHYSQGKPECCLCKQTQIEFLVLDHIDGGGKQHQKKVGKGSSFYAWITKANYPPGFQVLCHNCNFMKG